jgi:hypothetical protein
MSLREVEVHEIREVLRPWLRGENCARSSGGRWWTEIRSATMWPPLSRRALSARAARSNSSNSSNSATRSSWSASGCGSTTSVPSASAQWVVSACEHALGNSAWNLRHELLGRLWGRETTKPRRVSTRQIVATDGTARLRRCRRCRWSWMVCAPTSTPRSVNSLRSATISRGRLLGHGYPGRRP